MYLIIPLDSGRLLVNGNDFYVGNSSQNPAQLGLKSDIDSCFQSVSDGKTLIANAITGKGVTTSSSASFATMADNINNISGTCHLNYSGDPVSLFLHESTGTKTWSLGSTNIPVFIVEQNRRGSTGGVTIYYRNTGIVYKRFLYTIYDGYVYHSDTAYTTIYITNPYNDHSCTHAINPVTGEVVTSYNKNGVPDGDGYKLYILTSI